MTTQIEPVPVPAAGPDPVPDAGDAGDRRSWRVLGVDGQILALLALLVGLCVWFRWENELFSSWANIMNIGDAIAVIGLLAAGQTLVILAGGLDIAVGATAAVAGVVAAVLMQEHGWPFGLAIAAAVVTGLLLGGFNGFCVNILNVNAVITTLGTLQLFKGLAFFIEPDQKPVGVRNAGFQKLGTGRLFRTEDFPGIPVSFLFMLGIGIAVWVFLTSTDIGRNVYAVGGNDRAARLSGIATRRVRWMLYVLSGGLAAMGGLVIAARTGSANAEVANQAYELRAITAVFLGGAATVGGRGSMGGTLLAVLLVGVLTNGMNLIGISQFWQFIAQGALLIVAVAVGEWRKSRAEAARTA